MIMTMVIFLVQQIANNYETWTFMLVTRDNAPIHNLPHIPYLPHPSIHPQPSTRPHPYRPLCKFPYHMTNEITYLFSWFVLSLSTFISYSLPVFLKLGFHIYNHRQRLKNV